MKTQGIIYRVENEFGEGMYRAYKTPNIYGFPPQEEISSFLCDVRAHPTPEEDRKLMSAIWPHGTVETFGRYTNVVFGFQSLNKLKKWLFCEVVVEALDDHGFEIVTYRGIVYHGSTQSIIEVDSAETVGRKSLLTILD